MLKVQLPPNQQLRQGQKSPGSLPSEKAVSSVSDNFGGQSALERAKNDALVQAVVRRFDAEIVGVTDLRDESQGEVSIPGADLRVRALPSTGGAAPGEVLVVGQSAGDGNEAVKVVKTGGSKGEA